MVTPPRNFLLPLKLDLGAEREMDSGNRWEPGRSLVVGGGGDGADAGVCCPCWNHRGDVLHPGPVHPCADSPGQGWQLRQTCGNRGSHPPPPAATPLIKLSGDRQPGFVQPARIHSGAFPTSPPVP